MFSISSFCWAEVAVIVHPSNQTSLDLAAIKQLYLGETGHFADQKIALTIDLPQGDPSRNEFNRKVINKSDTQLQAYWSKLVFIGKAQPPKKVAHEIEALQLVADNPSAIAYVAAGSVDERVKVIAKF